MNITTFYNGLSSLVWHILKQNVPIFGGDMNAHLRKDGNNKFYIRNSPNRNGNVKLSFLKRTSLYAKKKQTLNFKKRVGELWTYRCPNNSKAPQNCMFINKKWMNSALKSDLYSSFKNVSSDHRIILEKIGLILRRNKKQIGKTLWYD